MSAEAAAIEPFGTSGASPDAAPAAADEPLLVTTTEGAGSRDNLTECRGDNDVVFGVDSALSTSPPKETFSTSETEIAGIPEVRAPVVEVVDIVSAARPAPLGDNGLSSLNGLDPLRSRGEVRSCCVVVTTAAD